MLAISNNGTAQVIVDPNGGGTHTDLQAGINAAPSGGIVEVRGGSYSNIVVTKSLTIVAEPFATLTSPFNGSPQQPAGITCTGTGGERLTLANVRVSGQANGISWSSAGAGISVADFAVIEATDCVLEGHVWTQLTGDGIGASGVEVTRGAPLIHLTRSTVRASRTDSTNAYSFVDGVSGIQAPQSVVVLTECSVTGGGGVGHDDSPLAPPTSCPCPNLRGNGGAGVLALETYVSQSIILGGQGADAMFGGVFWGRQPDGPAYVGSVTQMPGTFVNQWDTQLNGNVQIDLGQLAPVAFTLFGTPAAAPVEIMGGKLWLDPQASLTSSFGSSLAFTVPNDPNLIGLRFGAQFVTITSTFRFGRPHFGVIRR